MGRVDGCFATIWQNWCKGRVEESCTEATRLFGVHQPGSGVAQIVRRAGVGKEPDHGPIEAKLH